MLGSVGLLLLLFASQAAGIKDGSFRLDSEQNSPRLADLLKVSLTSRTSGLELSRRRSRRSVFLHSGVRICPQESIEDVLHSHQAYYQLRVCQEAVWEAFRIFLDRIPGSAEYQRWVHACQQESLCISDLAQNFSSSEEHIGMVHRRMSRLRDRSPPIRVVTPAPTHRLPEAEGPDVKLITAETPPGSAAEPTEPAEELQQVPNILLLLEPRFS
ncbi:interphotoreceptor matrix proteoglycan 1-like [Kryptolebias marmoratus]|uniref:interphotoreceptor matrix proteoglycan 1-like n=1 Tax=Kryptolebias marmoratus TaxID=37003 RepID=UPI0018ACC566|nr:interphotoreceptor matrix proteoglycan 1-like [Kryptolebias marmoratus]